MSENDGLVKWAKWFVADRATRSISPLSRTSVPQYVNRLLALNSVTSLREAVRMSPTNSLALGHLALAILEQDPQRNPRPLSEADFYSRRAVAFGPNDSEVAQIRVSVLERIASQKEKP